MSVTVLFVYHMFITCLSHGLDEQKFFEARVAVMGFKCRTMQLQGEVESLRRKLSETVRVAATSLDTNMELDVEHFQVGVWSLSGLGTSLK